MAGSLSGSVAASQNSELCHKLTALQNGFLHLFDCNRVLFRISFDSVTSEILVNALSDRYTHWSSVHNMKRYLYENETYGNFVWESKLMTNQRINNTEI